MLDKGHGGAGAVWIWDRKYGEVGWDSGGDHCGISDFGVAGVDLEALGLEALEVESTW